MLLRYFLLSLLSVARMAVSGQHIVNDISPEMVFIKAGSFEMGNKLGKKDAKPLHTVMLNDFYIGRYEVTQALWLQVMGIEKGRKSDCLQCPVFDVSMENITVFLSTLNQLSGKHYRLPTEAEWEYAASGGKESKDFIYCGSNHLEEVAWFASNSDMKTHPVGLKLPNELGLYDMSGNVWELCSDWYSKSFYEISPKDNPKNTVKSTNHVVRGGSWRSGEERCRVRSRNKDIRDHHISNCGFRLVMEL